jgi:hypothetical protein
MKRLRIILLSFILLSLNCSSLHPDRPVFKKGDVPGAITVLDTIIRNNLKAGSYSRDAMGMGIPKRKLQFQKTPISWSAP